MINVPGAAEAVRGALLPDVVALARASFTRVHLTLTLIEKTWLLLVHTLVAKVFKLNFHNVKYSFKKSVIYISVNVEKDVEISAYLGWDSVLRENVFQFIVDVVGLLPLDPVPREDGDDKPNFGAKMTKTLFDDDQEFFVQRGPPDNLHCLNLRS